MSHLGRKAHALLYNTDTCFWTNDCCRLQRQFRVQITSFTSPSEETKVELKTYHCSATSAELTFRNVAALNRRHEAARVALLQDCSFEILAFLTVLIVQIINWTFTVFYFILFNKIFFSFSHKVTEFFHFLWSEDSRLASFNSGIEITYLTTSSTTFIPT